MWGQPVALNGKVYVAGEVVVSKGFFKSPEKFPSIVEYDPKSDVWNALSPPKCDVGSSTLAIFRDQLIIVGDRGSKKIQSFDFSAGQWEDVFGEMPVGLSSPCVAGYQDCLIVACGSTDTGVKNEVHILNTLSNTWSTGTPLPHESIPHTSLIIGEYLYLMGTSVVEGFRTHLPTMISGSGIWDVLPTAPFQISSTVVFQDHILVFGGSITMYDYPSDREVFSKDIYCLSGSEWVAVGELPNSKKADGCLCITVSDELLMLRWSVNKKVYSAKVSVS